MPITVKISEGLIDYNEAQKLVKDLIDVFLEINGAYGNEFMSKNQLGDVIFIPKGRAFNGFGETENVQIICLVPSISLATIEQREDFIDVATRTVLDATIGKLNPDNVTIDMVYGVMWGIGGKLYTEKDLQEAVAAAAKD